MFYVLQNESTANLRRIPILLTDAATGTTAMVGVSTASIYPYVAINGGAFIGGTGPVYESGFGQYVYQMHPAETATLGLAGIHITAAACRDYDAIAQIAAFNVYSASSGATAGDIWSYDVSGIVGAGLAGSQLNLAATGGAGISAYDVWNFDPTAMTSPQAGAILTDIQTDTNSIITDIGNIPNNVWVSDVSGYVNPGEAGYELTQAAAGGGVTAGDVWTYDISAITGAGTAGTQLNLAAAGGGAGITAGEVANAVWNAQLATYATPATGEVFSTDTYGTKIARTIVQNRPAAIDTSQRITSVVSALNANVITATSIQAAAITSAKFATDAITSTVIAADAITSAELAPSANTEIADAVWAYATRNITGGTITTVNDKTGYSLSGSQTFDVTGNITGNLSGSVGSVTTVSNGAISASSFLAGAIDAAAVASDAVTEIANGVWSVGTRTITGGTITTVSDKTGYSLSGTQSFNLTGNITGNLSGSVGSVSGAVGSVTGAVGSVTGAVGSVTGAVGSVTADVNVSTTSMAGIANTVWSTLTAPYTTHATFGHNLLRSDNAATIGEVTLHQSGGSKRVDADVHAFVNNTASATAMLNILTGIGASMTTNITGNLSGSVGSVTNAVNVSTTSMTGIAGTVWSTDISSYTSPSAGYSLAVAGSGGVSAADVWNYNGGRTITGGIADTVTSVTNGVIVTTNNDKTGYALSGTQSFNLTGDITGNLSGSVGSVSGNVSGSVGSVVGAVGSVTSPVSVSTASMTGIAGTVWNTNISAITTAGTAGKQLNDAAASSTVVNIVNGPFRLTSNQNNSDGILDILQNSVQEINLNLIDGNGAPASTTGYSPIVNIFDVAGTAVTSYTPTGEYADGGIINFELDTDVTAVIGRYNMIVALSGAGFNVKYGPLQILVRPL